MVKMKLPNGFGSITKLSGRRRNPFMIRKTIGFNEFGVQQYVTLGYYPKYTDAMEALILFNKNQGNALNVKYTFEQVWKAFTEEKFTKHNESIPSIYNMAYSRCKELLKLSMIDINLPQLENAIKQAPTKATAKNVRMLLNQMYKYAIKHQIVHRNLVDAIDTIKQEKSDMHNPLSEDEIKLLWQHKNQYGAKLWLVYCYTGLRPMELASIKTSNINLEEGYMIGGIKTEAGTDRTIPLADCIIPIIKEWYNPEQEFLLLSKRNKPLQYNGIARELDRFCTTYGLSHKAHDGRHTCATLLDKYGVAETTIQKILGHATGMTNRIYIHQHLSTLRAAVNSIPVF